MALGEDLMLLAVSPRRGRIGVGDRIGFALRAAELTDLARAGRISLAGWRIEVTDTTPTGDRRLDAVLRLLQDEAREPLARVWIQGAPHWIVDDYLAVLARQNAIRVDRRRTSGGPTRISVVLLDRERRDLVRARVDRLARGGREDDTEDDTDDTGDTDRALAGLVHACGLAGLLYRGLRGRAARRRLAEFSRADVLATSAATGTAGDDATLARDVAAALSDGLAGMTDQLIRQLIREHRLGASTGYQPADLPRSGHQAGHHGGTVGHHGGGGLDGGVGGHHGGVGHGF